MTRMKATRRNSNIRELCAERRRVCRAHQVQMRIRLPFRKARGEYNEYVVRTRSVQITNESRPSTFQKKKHQHTRRTYRFLAPTPMHASRSHRHRHRYRYRYRHRRHTSAQYLAVCARGPAFAPQKAAACAWPPSAAPTGRVEPAERTPSVVGITGDNRHHKQSIRGRRG